MSEAVAKRERIKAKVAASQRRLSREDDEAPPPIRRNLPDANPPEDYRTLAAEYPLLTVAAGLGAGLLIGALLPRRFGSRFGRHALAVATMAGELGLALSKQARDAAIEAGHDGLERASEVSAPLRRTAARIAGSAGHSARSSGIAVAREVVKLASRVRK